MSTAAEQMLDGLERQFLDGERHNPLYVWEAIRFCAQQSLPLPQWCFSYLATCAERLNEIALEHAKSTLTDRSRRATDKVASVLGISRDGWNAFDRLRHDRQLVNDLMEYAGALGSRETLKRIGRRTTTKAAKRRLEDGRRKLSALARGAKPTP